MRVILIFILFSSPSFASEKEFKELMTNYLKALKSKDQASLKKIVSPQYMKFMQKTGLLKQTLKKQKSGKIASFDLIFKPMVKEKDSFFVNIKDPKKKYYSDYWFVIKKLDNKFIIDSTVFLD